MTEKTARQTRTKKPVPAAASARLKADLREALDRQKATAEVLRAISSSRGRLEPVFHAVLDNALRLCDAAMGSAFRVDGDEWSIMSMRGARKALEQHMRRLEKFRPPADSDFGRVIRQKKPIQTRDMRASPPYVDRVELAVAGVELGGIRTLLSVPMVKDRAVLGVLTVYRREVRPFSAKQIGILADFAAQAVIAIENARLLSELRESLDRQTATSEVLGVIAASPGELGPVFDTILDNALRLCETETGHITRLEADGGHIAALRGAPASFADFVQGRVIRFSPHGAAGRAIAQKQPTQVADLSAEPLYRERNPMTVAAVELAGVRAVLYVPMIRGDDVIGFITIYRRETRPFADKQIELVENFAKQAVIAIENARLLTELRARTDELAQRQAELRVTFDNMGDGVAMFDAEQRLVSWNRNLQEILDLPDQFFAHDRTFQGYITFLIERGEFGAVDLATELARYADIGIVARRVERTRPDGRVLEIRNNPVPGGGFVTIYSDVTERKRAEAQVHAARDAAEKALGDLKAAQASLVQAEKMASLGQLTAGIAHEIKNPLNFVNNFAGLSVELLGELKEAARDALAVLGEGKRAEVDELVAMLTSNLEKISEHGRRADGIVKSMLAHSRGGSGERQSVNVNALVEESLNLAYHGARAHDQNFNITLEQDLDAAIAPIELVPQDIARVFLNLFGNGFYAANKRRAAVGNGFTPVLKVSTRDGGGEVAIHIRDNGIGIAPEIREKLFEPFFTTKPTGEGTGLGLSISYEIVTRQHGGAIEVESEVGEFTEFIVRLPRRR